MLMNISHFVRTHRLVSLVLLCLISTPALSLLTVALAQTPTVTPSPIVLREGGKVSQVIEAKNAAGADVSPTLKSFTTAGVVEYEPETKTFKLVKVGTTTAKLEFKEGENVIALPDIEITVLPKIENYVISYGGTSFKHTDLIKIGQGVTWKDVKVTATNADGDPVEKVTATIKTGGDKLGISSGESPYTLTGRATGTATLTVKAPDDAGQEFKVEILAPIARASVKLPNVSLAERSTKTYTPEIRTTAGLPVEVGDQAYGVRIDFTPNDYLKLKDATTLQAQSIDVGPSRRIPAHLQLPRVATTDGTMIDIPPAETTFDVLVVATGAYMQFEPPTQPLLPGGSARIEAYFRDRSGARDESYHVTDWKVASQYEKYVALAKEGNVVTVIRLDDVLEDEDEAEETEQTAAENRRRAAGARGTQTQAAKRAATERARRLRRARRPSVIPILAEARSTANPDLTIHGTAYVQLREITKFQPLSVKLNVMDDTTAKDLYGGVAASEYYILMVRLFNDLRDDETKRYTGASIIVYSGSVEVAVNLEKQYDEKSKSIKKKSGNSSSTPNSKDSYVADGKWYELDPVADLHDAFADTSYTTKNPSPDETALPFGSDPVCEDTITYRPLMFEMVVNTADRREGRSLRSKVFDTLELVGLGTSFSSAIRFPRPGRDLPIISDRFTNLLVPGLEKLFPSLQEQHRQNIVSQVMKPLEEVPFGSDVTRVLFIPKRPLRGIMPDHKVRISQICPYYFKIKVAIVDKTGQSTVEQGVRR